jgi:hypothetical protein
VGMRLVRCLLLAGVSILVFDARALEPIDTDGPDFVESSEVVPAGHFQYELDVGSALDSSNGSQKALTSTPLLLKYGIAENLELRIESDGYMDQAGQQGVGNTAIGIKWHSQDRNPVTGAPAISWIAHFQMPTGSPYFRNDGVLPSLRSVITWDLSNGYALGLMPGIAIQANDKGEQFTAGIFGAVLNRKLDEKTRAFIELSMPTISRPEHDGLVASADVGAAYLASNDTQLGFRTGGGLNANSPRSYFLFEIAQRF